MLCSIGLRSGVETDISTFITEEDLIQAPAGIMSDLTAITWKVLALVGRYEFIWLISGKATQPNPQPINMPTSAVDVCLTSILAFTNEQYGHPQGPLLLFLKALGKLQRLCL
jgi:hypothetical protein